VYAGLERIGHRLLTATEELTTRMPDHDESQALQLEQGIPVMIVRRTTGGTGGRVPEALHIVAAGDRNTFIYDELPIVANGS
jgi:DNA-binding GntR family transcriptional regulator